MKLKMKENQPEYGCLLSTVGPKVEKLANKLKLAVAQSASRNPFPIYIG